MLRKAAHEAYEAFKAGVRLEITGLVASALLLFWAAMGRKGAVVAGLAGITALSLTVGYFFRRYDYITTTRRKAEDEAPAEDVGTPPAAASQDELREALESGLESIRSAVEADRERLLENVTAVIEAKSREILEALPPPPAAKAAKKTKKSTRKKAPQS